MGVHSFLLFLLLSDAPKAWYFTAIQWYLQWLHSVFAISVSFLLFCWYERLTPCLCALLPLNSCSTTPDSQSASSTVYPVIWGLIPQSKAKLEFWCVWWAQADHPSLCVSLADLCQNINLAVMPHSAVKRVLVPSAQQKAQHYISNSLCAGLGKCLDPWLP